MFIKGITNIGAIFVGQKEIDKGYLNDKIVYQKSKPPYIKFKANSSSTIKLAKKSTNQYLDYSRDGVTWSVMDTSTIVNLAAGGVLYVHGLLVGNNDTNNYTQFSITGDVKVSGVINTLWNYQDITEPLYNYCGYGLFVNCSGLTDVSELEFPSTTLSTACYRYMFAVCRNITKSPELKAKKLKQDCYDFMFYNCSSLNHIRCYATDISASNCTNQWVSGVASSGTFVKDANATSWTTGVSGIPNNWTVVDK